MATNCPHFLFWKKNFGLNFQAIKKPGEKEQNATHTQYIFHIEWLYVFLYLGQPRPPRFVSDSIGYRPQAYNVTWTTDSYSPITEYKLLYRKSDVSRCTTRLEIEDDKTTFWYPEEDCSPCLRQSSPFFFHHKHKKDLSKSRKWMTIIFDRFARLPDVLGLPQQPAEERCLWILIRSQSLISRFSWFSAKKRETAFFHCLPSLFKLRLRHFPEKKMKKRSWNQISFFLTLKKKNYIIYELEILFLQVVSRLRVPKNANSWQVIKVCPVISMGFL